MMKLVITLALFVFCTATGNAQEIAIGRQFPDVALTNIVNYPVKQAKISDFRGKLLILDFWATWCGPCVSMLSKTDSLQKQFDGKLQIMPVTTESEKTVDLFLEKLNRNKHILPPSVTGDTILRKLSTHTYIPHYVWINTNGTVVAVTGMEEITSKNIQAVLDGNQQGLPVKKDNMRAIDLDKAVFALGNPIKYGNEVHVESVNRKGVGYYSIFTGYIQGLPSFGTSREDSTRISVVNVNLGRLFMFAFGEFSIDFYSRNRLIVEARDTSLFFAPSYAQRGQDFINWLNEGNGYCYELQVPPSLVEKKIGIMQDELNRYFGALYGIEGKLEKRKQKVLALVRTSDKDKLTTKGQKEDLQVNKFYMGLKNTHFDWFLHTLKTKYLQLSPLPLFDETGITGFVDMEINANLANVQEINKELEKYDLRFVEKEKEINMIIIRDKK